MEDTYLSSPDPQSCRKGSSALFRSKVPPTLEENYRTLSTVTLRIVSTLYLRQGGNVPVKSLHNWGGGRCEAERCGDIDNWRAVVFFVG